MNNIIVINNNVELVDSEIIAIIKASNLEAYAPIVGAEIVSTINNIITIVQNGIIAEKEFVIKFLETSIKIEVSRCGINIFHKLFNCHIDCLYDKTEKLRKLLEEAFLIELYSNI